MISFGRKDFNDQLDFELQLYDLIIHIRLTKTEQATFA